MLKILTEYSVNSKVSTLNIITVILIAGYVFNSTFSTIWILGHSDRMNQDTLRLVFEVAAQNKEIILVSLGFIARGYVDQKVTNEKRII